MTTSSNDPADVSAVLHHIDTTILRAPDQWAQWSGGWPGEIGTGLIDAVFSARATYVTKSNRGVLAQVRAWRARESPGRTSLRALLAEMDECTSPSAWATDVFKNSQLAPGRGVSADGGRSKAAAIHEAASRLAGLAVPIDRADDILAADIEEVRKNLLAVQGIGLATSNYFLMLLGVPGVKPDVMVRRFLADALGESVSDRRAERLLLLVSEELGVAAHELDHAVWSFQRSLLPSQRT